MTCGCSEPLPELVDIDLPAEYGGGRTSIEMCMTCGQPVVGSKGETSADLTTASADLVAEYDAAAAAGAGEDELLALLTRRQFEAGVVYGSVLTARQLVEKVTFKGRLRRLRALLPFNDENMQEVRDLLLMGEKHNGS